MKTATGWWWTDVVYVLAINPMSVLQQTFQPQPLCWDDWRARRFCVSSVKECNRNSPLFSLLWWRTANKRTELHTNNNGQHWQIGLQRVTPWLWTVDSGFQLQSTLTNSESPLSVKYNGQRDISVNVSARSHQHVTRLSPVLAGWHRPVTRSRALSGAWPVSLFR